MAAVPSVPGMENAQLPRQLTLWESLIGFSGALTPSITVILVLAPLSAPAVNLVSSCTRSIRSVKLTRARPTREEPTSTLVSPVSSTKSKTKQIRLHAQPLPAVLVKGSTVTEPALNVETIKSPAAPNTIAMNRTAYIHSTIDNSRRKKNIRLTWTEGKSDK